MGLEAWVKATDRGWWEMNPATGTARRTEPLASTQLDTCASCHSRRHLLAKGLAPDAPFLDAALPSLLVPGQYHADGQIDGEVFKYHSFLQSAMHKAGVVCSNCHEPHAAKLRAEGNALCSQCHLPEKFDVTAHHKHSSGSAGAQCANCHMPTKTYMVVHNQRDHSLRVPRPDLSVYDRHPQCLHPVSLRPVGGMGGEGGRRMVSERSPDNAALRHRTSCRQNWRSGCRTPTGSINLLDKTQAAIVRASALQLLTRYASVASEPAIRAGITDPDPLVRMAAPQALPPSAPRSLIEAILPLLSDPVRAVRVEAARVIAGTDPQTMTPERRSAFASAYQELINAEMIDADRRFRILTLAF